MIKNTSKQRRGAAPKNNNTLATFNAPATVRPFSDNEFIELGLQLRSNGNSQRWRRLQGSSKITHFQRSYTAHPAAIAAVWKDLQTTPFLDARIDNTVQPMHLLIVYRWMSSYESEKDLYNTYGVPEKIIRDMCREITLKIARLRKIKVMSLSMQMLAASFFACLT